MNALITTELLRVVSQCKSKIKLNYKVRACRKVFLVTRSSCEPEAAKGSLDFFKAAKLGPLEVVPVLSHDKSKSGKRFWDTKDGVAASQKAPENHSTMMEFHSR